MDKQEIASKVKNRRKELGLTINAVVERAIELTGKRHNAAQIKYVEDGSKNYSIGLLATICKILDLDIVITDRY